MPCAVADCPKPAKNAGMCWGHYKRQRRWGSPTGGYSGPHEPCRHRIERFIERSDEGCWLWTGALNPNGYGLIFLAETARLAHRVAYTEYVGPIPDGMPLDHLCRVKRCVAPDHLEAVTASENTRRAWPYRADYRGATP